MSCRHWSTGMELVPAGLYASAKGEKAWPLLVMFKALLLAAGSRSVRWAACRRSKTGRASERAAFARFRRELIARGLDRSLFEAIARDL